MPAPPTPEMIRNIFEEIENTRTMGIWLASKYVLEHRYKAAKDMFEKLLQLSPNDVEIMALYANPSLSTYFLIKKSINRRIS